MSHWVFVMNGTKSDFKKRVNGGKWPIYTTTHHRNELRRGDEIVFYLAGKPNKVLVGTAKVSSKLEVDKTYDFTVGISDVEVWKEPKPIKELLSSLSFIKNKDNWGMHLQGGVIPLPVEDYKKMCN